MGDFRRQRYIFLLMFLVFLTSCSPFSSKKPPIILILLESFSEQDYLCSDPRKTDDLFELQEVCDEFMRFTHVYAPSSLTQTNVSDLFTGLPVSEHQVIHNGALSISNRLQTLAESALNVKMRTAFFSGGVPLLQKFGVSQGYEEFFEPFSGKEAKFFTPFSETSSLALKWIEQEAKSRPFFLTLYVPDLLYKNRVTLDGLDNERPVSRVSNLQEIYETMNGFIAGLKAQKKWENSHVIILGLSGPQQNLYPINPLSSRFLHVPLQIKLSKRVRTNLQELSSEVVSFSKLGQWLEKLIQHKPSQKDLIFSPNPGDHLIPQQQTWAYWQGLSNWKTVGLRREQYLFSFNPGLFVFDSFFDKREYEPLTSDEAERLAKKYDVLKLARIFFKDQCLPGYSIEKCEQQKTDEEGIRQLSLLSKWSDHSEMVDRPNDNFGSRMGQAFRQKDNIIISWMAYRALYNKEWVHLFELGKKARNRSWTLLAQINLREPVSQKLSGCLKYFTGERKNIEQFYQYCQDSGLRRVVEGLDMLKNKKRPEDGFWSQVSDIKGRRFAKHLNLKMLLINDVKNPFNFGPSLSELYFFLPENSEYLELIDIDKT